MSNNTMSTVNDVITDSVSQVNTLLGGLAAPKGNAMLDVVSAETIGMTMHNAITAQQNAQITSNASVTSACARMLAVEQALPPEPAGKESPPPFMPLTPAPTPGGAAAGDPDALLKMASQLAENAIQSADKDGQSSQQVQQTLSDLISKLQSMQSTPSPSPAPSPAPGPSPAPAPAPSPAPGPSPTPSPT